MRGDGTMDEERIAGAGRALEEEGREAESRIAAAEPAALAFAHRLLAAIRVILNEHGPKIPDSICGVVAYSLYAKIYGNCRATYRLCRLGHSLDAPIVNRSAVEAVITLRFITISKEECHKRAEHWAKFSEVLKWKAAENNSAWLPHDDEDQRR